jgi:hypothetical protein
MTTRTFGNGLSAGALILLGPFAVLTLWLLTTLGAGVSPLLTLALVGVMAMGAAGATVLLLRWGKTG